MKAISVSVNRFLLAAALLLAGLCLLFTSANEALAQACPGADDPPTPTSVAVSAAPIVVESTTADYFVLYASHDVDGETLWHPVQVTLGEDGTTTLAENVAPLPVERYRVEKYSIAEPADVDSDCTDDITELNDLGPMNPVNPGAAIELEIGALAIPDQETFEALNQVGRDGKLRTKYVIAGLDTDRPSVYFQNINTFQHHALLMNEINVRRLDGSTIKGVITYDPELDAADGSLGVYRYTVFGPPSPRLWDRIYTLFGASMPVLEDNLALWVSNRHLPQLQADLPLSQTSRMNLVFDEDVYGETDFQALNPVEGYGLLRSLEPDERPNSRDVVIYETLPNELPRVAGIISTVPQTPLSHVNLRARQDNVPNAFIAGALENDDISRLIGSHVYYAVADTGYLIRAATHAEVDEHFASSRPAEAQTPQRNLSVTTITPLSDIGFDGWDSFGVKAANLAVLRTLGFPEGTVPNGFAAPFYFYDEFMKHNDLYDYIEEMLEDSDFQTDYDTKADELKKLRKKIKKAETPEWIETALTEMHATFPEGTSLRYRSSTNNEDLPNFNGAGLYDSKTQHPEETEEDGISKSLKQVYASLWNFRAFIERDFHRVDHLAAAMGVLVHPNYSDKPVNGVAVSVDPAYGTEETYYVNSQVGEDLVTNPEAKSAPEEVLLYPDETYTVFALSNQVLPGQLLMTDDQLAQLRRHLAAIHEKFAELYGVEDGERFAMEIEFKITSDNVLAIKQARPWVFTGPPPEIDDALTGHAGAALTAGFRDVPATHNGSPFSFRIDFSEDISIGFEEFTGYTMAITGGSVTKAVRVDERGDLWDVTVDPDSYEHVTIVLTHNRHCLVVGAICTSDGRRLSTRLERTVRASPPPVPRTLTGRSPSSDIVELDWKKVPGAQTYEVQFRHTDTWIDLPADGTEIAFDGAGAVVSSLPVSDDYYFRVRALNSGGASGWSPHLIVKVRLDWESELTPGQDTSVLPVELGYAKFGYLGGTLSPDEFVLNGTTYTVQFLVHSRESLWLGTSPELPADFTLFVGDSDYRGRESMVSDTTVADAGYWWPSASLDWNSNDPVRVGLLTHPEVPVGRRQKAPVTGYFRNYPPEHDGNAEFSFRIYFSEGIPTTAAALREHVLSVSGGAVSSIEAVGSEGRIWTVSVTPESHHPVTVGIEADLDCRSSAAICAADGRRLFNRMDLTVQAVENSPATGAPTITGTVEVGEILTTDTSDIDDANRLTGAPFSYQWMAYDGHSYTDIQGATDSTYTLLPTDEGKAFRVRVSFNDYVGYEESLTSALARSERPYGLNASESDGAVALTWRVPAGWTGSTFQILRHRPELGQTEPQVHVSFVVTSENTYTDADVEPGVLYVYRVKRVDPFGYTGEVSQPFEIRTATSSAPSDTLLSLARGSRPNVVLILADDLGWGDIQTNNPDSAMTTPRIDSIAAAGAYFTDAHTPSSVCTGTRYGLLTGRYSWRSWMTSGVLDGHARPLIGPDRPTLGTLLQGRGYRTAAIGKWHLGMDFARLSDVDEVTALNRGIDFRAEIVDGPLDHGFHEFFGTSANLRDAPAVYIDNRRFVANPETPGHSASGFLPYEEVLDRLTEEAVSFIGREGQTDDPFFLYLPLTSPHVPLAPDEDFAGLTGLGAYADVVAQVDWTVGQVLDALGRVGARDDTLVIFTSDNGSFMAGIPVPNHVDHQPNGMWRGGKGAIHEGGHRVPLLLQWPRGIEAGLTVDATVSLTDMYATLADIVGEAPGPGVAPDGVSLLPLLLGEVETRGTPVVHHSSAGMFALRDGQWKLVFGKGGGLLQAGHSRPFERPWELFDMEQDTGELRSVAETRPEIMARMEATLNQLRAAEEVTLSGDATLRSLSLAGINIGPFDPGVLTYSATVANHIKIVEVTAIPTATDAIVTISDGNGSNKRGRRRVRLTDPTTTIEVTVTAPDTSAITTYTVRLARPPEAPKGPSIAGTADVGETLMVDTSVITDPDGLTGATFSYQWVSYDGNAYTDIPGATSTTYTLVQIDESKAFRVRVSFIDDAGNQEKRTSTLARSKRPHGLNASESDSAVTLTWRVPVGWTGSTFRILRNRPELGEAEPLVHVRFTESGMTTYTDTDVEPGVLYVYRVKGVDPFGYTGEASDPVETRTEDTAAASARPNVVLILADDLGWGDIQTNNADSAMTTPRIDGIAVAGAYFTDAHTPSSMCSPTRYGLLTGRYAWRTWLTSGVLGGHDRPMIGPDRATLGTLLQDHGYRTAAIGKWHVGMDFTRLSNIDEFTPTNGGIDFDAEIVDGPLDHGFNEFFGTSANLRWEPHAYIRDRRFLANPSREGQPASGFYEFKDVLDRLTEEAVAFIEREGQTEAPFFLYLPVHTPHVPLIPNDHFDGLTGLGHYADVVAQLDWAVGQVLDTLDRVGARDDTLVIFTSDNGSFMEGIPVPNHLNHWSSGRWRGGKGQIHEGGHRVPLLMQWPRGIEAGSTVDATVSLTDMYATLADIVGEEAAPGVALDSVSLLPLLRGEDVTRGVPVVHHSRTGMFALRDGYWKLVLGNGDGGVHGTNTGEPFGRPWRLIDLERDHKEKRNAAKDNPQVVARMEAALERLRAAEDGTLSADATLRSLNLAGIDIGPFDPGVRTYAATVAKRIENIAVSAIPTAMDAHVTISDASGSANKGHRRVRLAYPATTIEVTVTSPDSSATTTYTVTVTRSGVTVVGTPQVWETLSVDTSGVADADGLTGATFGYQWVRNDGGTDTDIVGATSPTYVLAAEDEGKSVKVRVSFTDDGGNAETRSSPPTPEVEPALTAEFQRVPDTHESTTFVFHVLFSEPVDTSSQALREHSLEMSNGTIVESRRVDGRNDLWEIEVQPRTHADVVVTLPPTVDCADLGAVCTNNGKRFSSRLQITVAPSANSPPQGAPTIGGTPEVGQTLTADTSGIADDNGLTGATFIYQWVSYDGHADTDIQGATDSTYTLVPADEGNAFRVSVLFTDDDANSHSLTSPLARSERPYGLNASESDGVVTLTWRLPVGWTGSTFQILRNRPELGEAEPLVHVQFTESGMTAYTDTDVEPGVLYVYRVKGVDPFGYTGEVSDPDEIRTAGPAPVENSPATGAPTITGMAQVGETVTVGTSGIADADGLTGATFSYQWLADGTNIRDAKGSSYTLTAADVGKTIRVRVSFTDDAGNGESLTSAATGAVEPAAPPAPQDLTAVVNQDGSITLTWTAPDDDSITGYQVLRRRPSRDETTLAVYLEDTGSTGTTYTDTDTPNGDTYVYRVKAINPAGTGEWSNYVRIVRSNE